MKKVFIVHGFEGEPNGGWRPWLMGELAKEDVYACALPMKSPYTPKLSEWVGEVERQVEANPDEEIYLVGHSLGVPTILHYLASDTAEKISGAVLVSGPCETLDRKDLSEFLDVDFDFKKIKSNANKFAVVHGDDDPAVPFSHAEKLRDELNAELFVVENGGHLNGSAGWTKLPQCLEALKRMMK